VCISVPNWSEHLLTFLLRLSPMLTVHSSVSAQVNTNHSVCISMPNWALYPHSPLPAHTPLRLPAATQFQLHCLLHSTGSIVCAHGLYITTTWHSSWFSDPIVTCKLGSESGCGVIHRTVSVSVSALPGHSPIWWCSDTCYTIILSLDTSLPG